MAFGRLLTYLLNNATPLHHTHRYLMVVFVYSYKKNTLLLRLIVRWVCSPSLLNGLLLLLLCKSVSEN